MRVALMERQTVDLVFADAKTQMLEEGWCGREEMKLEKENN